ncbi:MAG: sugar ABC transporter ATP-binding protein [Acetobacteraceae bacterium]
MALLSARGVCKRFGGIAAVDSVDIEAEAGRVLGLLGANGSGKSTLSGVISGEVTPDSCTLLWRGRPLVLASPQHAARQGIVIAHQQPGIAPDLPVWENIFLGIERCRRGGFVNRRESRREAQGILDELGAPMRVDALGGELGAAGQQLVEIARAVMRAPRLLILDEPTAALSAAEVARLFAVVRRLTASGAGVIFISHRLQEVEQLCDAIMVLRNGRRVGAWSASGRLDEQRILELMTGDPEAVLRPTATRKTGATRLKLEEVRAGTAVKGVDLALREGEIVGLAGLQGQGQEELLEVVAGLRRLDGGRILHNGARVTPRRPRDMIRRGVCLVPNDRRREGLFIEQTVGENLTYVRVALDPRPWQMPFAALAAAAQATVRRLLIRTQGLEQPINTLSGGNQQKVVVGKWLATELDVLLLSDPTKGVDIHARAEIYAALAELAARGAAVLVFASDVQELLRACDRILVMYEGRIADELAGAAMNEARVMAAAFGKAA